MIIDNAFAYNVALDIMNENEDHEPRSVDECRRRPDWPKWKDAIQCELDSLAKRKAFGPVVQTPEGFNMPEACKLKSRSHCLFI